jgi:formate hydrogenlyase subunit 3/multisubunit Na+/H+ antiporter MnhD subunit
MAIQDEFYPHEIFLRLSYLAFVIFSAIFAIGHIKEFLNFYFEAASGILGFIFYIFASMWSMSVVEQDKHLQYLSEADEYAHLFFQINRFQSVLALIAGMLFLLHATFSIDYILGSRNREIDSESSASLPRSSSSSVDSGVVKNALKLHFFPETLWERVFSKKR